MIKVSCLCPTFARAYLLEESVFSFLQQDYEHCELIICNDMPKQQFVFDHPRVKIINQASRCTSLGEKRNLTASYATGDVLLTWGDDDIHLKHRISRMVHAYERSPYKHIIREGAYITLYGEKVVHSKNSPAGACLVNTSSFHKAGGIPLMNCGEDCAFLVRMRSVFPVAYIPEASGPPAFIYRWSGSNRPHISGFGEDKEGKKSGWDRMLERAEQLLQAGKEPSGTYNLSPVWRRDYYKVITGEEDFTHIYT
ncbi:MAG: glycosyltransferase family 2 protein [Candidatus Competibacteraceae bacterium]|nr:glycosyltransferase family 2 protein [Candidatus Competibacteraceae bacterium]